MHCYMLSQSLSPFVMRWTIDIHVLMVPQEAKNALEGVGGIHLYGRRLVVEYAKDQEGLDELRAKTGAKFRDDDDVAPRPGKKMKL